MKKNNRLNSKLTYLGAFFFVQLTALAGTNMAWEKPLEKIMKSITGPVATSLSIISVVVAGLTWAFSEGGGMFGKAIKIVLGIVIALGGAQIITSIGLKTGSGAMLLFM